MPHLALYRRLRPKDFSEIIGQEHIVRILKNQLSTGTVSHAYLFCGTRGTGKTSMAKILAKALNCTNLTDDGPCGECQSCIAAAQNRNLNIIEIDAASNNGVDNIREIREEVKYPPQDNGVKVYIIDEVHMLSTGAFNALLKTLEEPPAKVVFILATTDPQRIPATILSRCVRLDFRRITVDEMNAALREFTGAENIQITDEALRYICSISDGAMRDALSLLDQCISYYPDEEIGLNNVLELTGAVDNRVFFDLMEALIAFDSGKSLSVIDDMVNKGRDVNRFISDFIYHLRNLLIITSSEATGDILVSEREKYIEQGKKAGSQRIMAFIHEFSALSAALRFSFNERIMLECLCIKLCNPQSDESGDNSALIARIEKLESIPRAVSLPKAEKVPQPDDTIKPWAPSGLPKPTAKSISKSLPKDIDTVVSEWPAFRKTFQAPISAFLEDTRLEPLGEGLCIVFSNNSWISHVSERKGMISEAFLEKYGKDFPLTFIAASEYNIRHGEKSSEPDTKKADAAKQLAEKLGNVEIEWE
ncbi:MAG: DNA polymerase III subunit gamma/tau [Defluviitaleaceae bacterium]|nr:DNA polymerase III subunit gamma/tau [Defluviitaleaceae bacterium]